MGPMLKVNTTTMEEVTWDSPQGKFRGTGKEVSEALGRNPQSMDLNERHPFDVEILRIAAGQTPYPYHSHSAQWEFYHVISGEGTVRHQDGTTRIETGDAFLFKPGEPHQLINDSAADLVLYVVADNPIGECHYYPDSNKWGVPIPERKLLRGEVPDYFDGEE
jgi:mannose-6-phosphate isomerase-like protein (cupin superfamily)